MPQVNENNPAPAFWRSLDELSDAPEFRARAGSEFNGYEPDQVLASPTRRTMIKLMGASAALAGGALAGCRRWPEKQVAPFKTRPEGRIPGVPERYATVFEFNGVAQPLLVSSYDGRPIKVEGNPEHPASRGAASTFAQASILDLYDPERSQNVTKRGEKSSWEAFRKEIEGMGLGFAVLSEASSSPTQANLLAKIGHNSPWCSTYAPINQDNECAGAGLEFGKSMRTHPAFDKASVIVCFDADPICGKHPASVKYAKDFAAGRRDVDHGKMSRLYVVESTLTITGTNADRRLAVKSSRILLIVLALANEIGISISIDEPLSASEAAFVAEMAHDLKGASGRGVLVAGESQPALIHSVIALINDKLGHVGKTITYTEAGEQKSSVESIRELVEAMNAGRVKTLLMLGGNPVYDAPADLGFAEALKKVPTTIHLSHYVNETSAACTWHLPRSHYLEAWGDARSWDGTLSVVQPLIQPLYDTRSAIEVLAMVSGVDGSAYDHVRETFAQWIDKGTFERGWRKVLRNGLLEGSENKAAIPSISITINSVSATIETTGSLPEWELTFTSDYSVFDGRFANNGWLQELPDPITKIVWDNAAMVSPADATKLAVKHGDMIRLKSGSSQIDLPVFVLPGQANGSIAVSIGYGRTEAGYIGTGVGYNACAFRRSDAMHTVAVEKPQKLGRSAKLVTTQDHYAIDQIGMNERQERVDRWLLRTAPLEYYASDPGFAGKMEIHTPQKINETGRLVPLQIFDEPVDFENVHRWGMSIDLSSCVGCGSCVVACQAENNIPIVGKEEVSKNREMHWIRIDRYFTATRGGQRISPGTENLGDESISYQALHQPLTCHHCETAPCEQVCPVAATVHDSEGLNVMIYNRCVGTRYCSNNCPYKVRRFNYFDWHSKPVHSGPMGGTFLGFPDQQQEKSIPSVRRMGFNPEVTVRMRGVMEKCTFCTQRIKAATIPALNDFRAGKRDTPRVADGSITPACAQTCPTEAIVFGDLNDPKSRISQLAKHNRSYTMLNDVNTRPRTSYLARITNPGHGHGVDPIVPQHGDHGGGHGGGHEDKHEPEKHG